MRGPRQIKPPVSGHGRAVREARISAGKTLVQVAEEIGVWTGMGSVVEHEPDFAVFLREIPRAYVESLGFRVRVVLEPISDTGEEVADAVAAP